MDIAERLEQILGDENALSQIQQMAATLRGDGNSSAAEGGGCAGSSSGPGSGSGAGMGSNPLGSLMGMLGGSGGGDRGSDPNVGLIRALKPFLSQKRKKRAGEAVKMMKLFELLPLLKQSGMLENLMGGGEDE